LNYLALYFLTALFFTGETAFFAAGLAEAFFAAGISYPPLSFRSCGG
jgi:hypothetical protein